MPQSTVSRLTSGRANVAAMRPHVRPMATFGSALDAIAVDERGFRPHDGPVPNSRAKAAAPPADSDRPTSGQPVRDPMWTVAELLTWTQERFAKEGIATPRLDAEHLLADAMQCSRMNLYVRHQEVVPAETKAKFRELVRRRLEREPVAYIEGKKGFHALDLELHVDPRVLIPRPETEHLVDWVLEELRPPPAPPMHVLDVGTGSGAIALALARARPDVDVTACDVSAAALEVATSNRDVVGLPVTLVRSDLLEAVRPPEGGWTAIVANLPYIPTADYESLQPEITKHEPRVALDGGPDGLDTVRRLVAQASGSGVLAPHGSLYLEIGIGQAEAVAKLLAAAGFQDVQTRADYAGIPRIVRGFLGPAAAIA